MLKKFQKVLTISIALLMLMSVTCFAENAEILVTSDNSEEDVTTSSENSETILTDESNSSEDLAVTAEEATVTDELAENDATQTQSSSQNIMEERDLYFIDTEVNYNGIVDGNFYAIGETVVIGKKSVQEVSEMTQIGGDVFILAKNVVIESNCYIYGNLYVLAESVTINGLVYGGDLYAACSEITIAESGAVNRDMRVAASKLTFNGGLGRNAYVYANDIIVSENAQILGSLNYSSEKAVQVPSGVVKNGINFTETSSDDESENTSNRFLEYLMSCIGLLVLTLAVFGVIVLFAPKFLSNVENADTKSVLPSLGIGALALIITLPIAILLMITTIGLSVALTLIAIWALFTFILATPIAIISIGSFIAKKIGTLKKCHNIFAVILTTLVIWIIGFIPYLGGLVEFLVTIYGLGLIIRIIWKNRTKKEKVEETPVENIAEQ